MVDTSVLIDGRILPIVNSGFMAGTLLIPEFVLGEIQHIADSSDSLRRAKGRRGLEVVNKLTTQKVNELLVTKIIKDDVSKMPGQIRNTHDKVLKEILEEILPEAFAGALTGATIFAAADFAGASLL